MSTLAKTLRSQLENTVKSARDVAEKGAHAALSQLAVGGAKGPDCLTEDLRSLRRRLRAHGRALGDLKAGDDSVPEPERLETQSQAAEIRKLKAELRRVTEERDILKKAAAYFAKESR